MDDLSALSGIKPTPAPTPAQPLPSRVEKAVNAAKTVAERQIPAVPEDALTEAYHQMSGHQMSGHQMSGEPDTIKAETRVQLDVDSSTGRVIGKVVDKLSGEVMHQLPTPEMLQLIAKAKELFGDLVNEKV